MAPPTVMADTRSDKEAMRTRTWRKMRRYGRSSISLNLEGIFVLLPDLENRSGTGKGSSIMKRAKSRLVEPLGRPGPRLPRPPRPRGTISCVGGASEAAFAAALCSLASSSSSAEGCRGKRSV
eukprot:scaffold89043_cov30-Tisochrysis_lutea.AAC.4